MSEETFDPERIEELRLARDNIVPIVEPQRLAALPPRTIISDEEDRQVQKQGNILYFYRKDFLYKRGSDEYSLVLLYSKEKNDYE